MKVSNLRVKILSGVIGVAVGLMIMASLVIAPRVSADEEGAGWCPDRWVGMTECIGGTCFKPIAGTQRCIYLVGGSTCNDPEHACQTIPEGD